MSRVSKKNPPPSQRGGCIRAFEASSNLPYRKVLLSHTHLLNFCLNTVSRAGRYWFERDKFSSRANLSGGDSNKMFILTKKNLFAIG